MGITQEGDYALRVVLYLSRLGHGVIVEAKTIAASEKIPFRFLLKLLRKLTMAKIIQSYRGVGGGYALAKMPCDITLKDVIEAIEGPIYLNRCMYDVSYCNLNRTSTCDIHSAFNTIQQRLISDLESITFKNILESNV